MACSCCTVKVLLATFLLCVAFFIVSLVLAFKVFPDVLYSEVNKALRLEEGSDAYDRFLELPFPITFNVYIFDVQNPDDILQGSKPKVKEIGPFKFKQYRKKTILYTDSTRDEIAYTQMERFEFDEEGSAPLKYDQSVTVLNAPLMSIYQTTEQLGILTGMVDHCIRKTFPPGHDQIFIKTTVRELLFNGFNFCKNTEPGVCSLINDVVCAIAGTKRNIDILPDFSLQFSYLNYKRREPDGKYLVKRGIDDITTLGHIVEWNDQQYTKYWGENTTCSRVKGTDATLYPPRVEKDNHFFIYATDICRFVEINYKGEASYKGIDGYLFGTDEYTLRPADGVAADDCYCSKLSKNIYGNDDCYLDGVIDMQTCFGVAVIFSFPHFLWANEKYANDVDGLNASEDLHKIYLLVEPNTGTPLQGMKRIQLNGAIRPIVGVKTLVTARRALLPLLWVEEGIALPDKWVDELHTSYFDKVTLVEGLKWGILALSVVLTAVSGGFLYRKRQLQKASN